MPVHLRAKGRSLAIRAPLTNIYLPRLQAIPGKKHWEGNALIFEPSSPTIDYVRRVFPEAEWEQGALNFCQVADAIKNNALPAPIPANVDFSFKTKPFEHQDKVFRESRDKQSFALLMEQGTGKTKVILDNAAWLFASGQIRGLLIVAKNGVHRNWIDNEVPAHLPDWCPRRLAVWHAQRGEKKIKHVLESDTDLAILAVNTEALSTKRGELLCERFLLAYPSMMVVDESTSIKTPGAKRTKAALRLGGLARYRRILTGTPITKGPLDAYAQFSFLDEEILGFTSFFSFRARYAVLQPLPGKNYHGRPVQIVVAYQNLDELREKIKKHSYRVLKRDCLDLPEKLYQRLPFELTEEQWKHYESLEEKVCTEFQGRIIAAPLALTKLLRLHQVACGFLPAEMPGEIGIAIGKNPRLELLLDTLDNIDGKVIIYANYRFNLREIWGALREKYGNDCAVAYSGSVKADDRAEAVARFQDENSGIRFFVGQVEAAGYGLTLTGAHTVIYYSNNHNLETRLQSEDRAHRIGQRSHVLYIDLQAHGTVDEEIIDSLIAKHEIASHINGDSLVRWIERNREKRKN